MWLNVGAVKDFGDCFADIQVESPVIVHNFLPVPSEVELRCQKGLILGLRGSINPRSSFLINSSFSGFMHLVLLK